jgi:hypothetical protein
MLKRIVIFVLGLSLLTALFSQTITNTNISVNGSDYSCKGTSYTSYDGIDLGTLGTLMLNASIKNSGTTGISTGYMYYRFDGGDWVSLALTSKTTISEQPPERIPGSSIAEGNSSEVISLKKTLVTYEVFSRPSDYTVDMSGLTNGSTYDLDVFFRLGSVYDPADTTGGNYYSATYTKTADIGFTDGSSFSPDAVTKGSNTQIIGRFHLNADVTGASLTGASFDLSGDRTGLSNYKLWASTDAVFNEAEDEYTRTVSTDPGASPLVFSSFIVNIPVSGKYFFLTVDVDAEASGNVKASIGETADLTITSGLIGETILNADLSSSDIPTSIELASMTAEVKKGKVELAWTTESETENSHFIIYRNGEKVGQVPGQGTCSDAHDYCFTDPMIIAGVYEYVLADVSFSGHESKQAPVYVEIEEHEILADFVLEQAYPNPFNPSTTISYRLSADSHIDLSIYNTSGKNIGTLFTGEQNAGRHQVIWNAAGLPSGIYVVRLMSDGMLQTMKIVLMK